MGEEGTLLKAPPLELYMNLPAASANKLAAKGILHSRLKLLEAELGPSPASLAA